MTSCTEIDILKERKRKIHSPKNLNCIHHLRSRILSKWVLFKFLSSHSPHFICFNTYSTHIIFSDTEKSFGPGRPAGRCFQALEPEPWIPTSSHKCPYDAECKNLPSPRDATQLNKSTGSHICSILHIFKKHVSTSKTSNFNSTEYVVTVTSKLAHTQQDLPPCRIASEVLQTSVLSNVRVNVTLRSELLQKLYIQLHERDFGVPLNRRVFRSLFCHNLIVYLQDSKEVLKVGALINTS